MAGIGKIAIIGAGMAGLACARRLADAGANVAVFDKGRGLGGRIATRRGSDGAFDHGAVALPAATVAGAHAASYNDYLAAATAQGAAAYWPAAKGWVGLPGMSGIVKPLANGLSVHTGVEVTGLTRGPHGWHLQGQGTPEVAFDQVILAIPQPQAAALVSPFPTFQASIAGASMRAVWTAMARFADPLPLEADLHTRPDGPIAQAIRTSAKPGRDGLAEAWVIHASAPWTQPHLELAKPEAAALLLAAFFAAFDLPPVPPLALEGHRWRYGLTEITLGHAFLRDAALGLSICGDWCLGDTALDAYTSGQTLAESLLAQ